MSNTLVITDIIPIVPGFGGVLLLNESFTPGMLAGMALIILGIATLNRAAPKSNLPEIEPI